MFRFVKKSNNLNKILVQDSKTGIKTNKNNLRISGYLDEKPIHTITKTEINNKIFKDIPINYNRSKFNKDVELKCLGYRHNSIVHNCFINKSINRYYSELKILDIIKPSTTTTTTTTAEGNNCKVIKDSNNEIKKVDPLEQHKDYFTIVLNSCGGSKLDDIYNISFQDFQKTPEGRSLAYFYGKSVFNICRSIYPNHQWIPWLFIYNRDISTKRKQPGYDYHDEIVWYSSIKNITDINLDEWYNISLEEFRAVCKMTGLVTNNQLISYIQKVYPHHNFQSNKFNNPQLSKPNLKLIDNQIKKFNIALNSCGGLKLDDIYNISFEDLIRTPEGASLVNYYGHSIVKICKTLFPNHHWIPWLFKKNIELSLERKKEDYDYHDEIVWYASINNITDSNLDEWYSMCLEDFKRSCKMTRNVSNNQLISFIQKVFPHHCFQPNQFTRSRVNELDPRQMKRQIKQFYIALNSCGGTKLDDIYNISFQDFYKIPEGRSLIYFYGNSIIRICSALFPNYQWIPWLFKFSNDLFIKRLQPDYDFHDEIIWFASINNITDSNLDEWNNISLKEFRKVCKINKRVSDSELILFFKKTYPHHQF
ncbi:hypothetical protein ACTFIV_002978 [Dictyostelium citrinum]